MTQIRCKVVGLFSNALLLLLACAPASGQPMRESEGQLYRQVEGTTNLRKVVADPLNANVVLGIDPSGKLQRSLDQGLRFETLPVPGNQVLDVAFDGLSSQRILALTDVGAQLSEDRGLTWRTVFADARTSSDSLYWDPQRPRLLFLTVDDTIYRSFDRGATWVRDQALPQPIAMVGGSTVSPALVVHQHVLTVDGSVWSDRGEGYQPDERWTEVSAIDQLLAFPCGLIGRSGERLWFTEASSEAPAQIADLGAPVLEVAAGFRTCSFVARLEDRLVLSGGAPAFFSVPAGDLIVSVPIPDGGIDAGLASHRGTFYLPRAERFDTYQLGAPDTCREDVCARRFGLLRGGFYIARLALPQNGREGLFGVSLDIAPQDGFIAGAVLPEGGEQPGFMAFRITEPESVELQIEEYSGNIAALTLELQIIGNEDERSTVFGPFISEPGNNLVTPVLEPGRYVLSIRSQPGDDRGRFGVAVGAQSIARGADIGGFIDATDQRPFIAFSVTGSVEIATFAGESYGAAGADMPNLELRLQQPEGTRLRVFPSTLDAIPETSGTITRLLDAHGNQFIHSNNDIALSPDGSSLAYLDRDGAPDAVGRRAVPLYRSWCLSTATQVTPSFGASQHRERSS